MKGMIKRDAIEEWCGFSFYTGLAYDQYWSRSWVPTIL